MTTTFGLLPVATISQGNPNRSTITLVPVRFTNVASNARELTGTLSPSGQSSGPTCVLLSPNLMTPPPTPTSPSSTNSISPAFSSPVRPPKRSRSEQEAVYRCKRRLEFTSTGHTMQKGAGISKRNERERKRVELLNSGFNKLQDHLPTNGGKNNKKVSKMQTLKSAVEYIHNLQKLLRDNDDASPDNDRTSDVMEMQSSAVPEVRPRIIEENRANAFHHSSESSFAVDGILSPTGSTSSLSSSPSSFLSTDDDDDLFSTADDLLDFCWSSWLD